jgi:flavin-dependent dehydrogenase
VDRTQFDSALRNKAKHAGTCYSFGSKFTGCERQAADAGGGWQVSVVHTASGSDISNQQLNTRFLLDATGRQAVVAKSVGIQVNRTDKLCAFVQLYQSDAVQETSDFTLLEATQDGWWYSNLLPDGEHRVVVFHTDRDMPQAKLASSQDGFDALLQRSGHILSTLKTQQFEKCKALKSTTACSQRLEHFTAEGFLAIGDAAQAYDPLSSQGMAKALQSGVSAGQLVSYALESVEQPELVTTYLERYSKNQEKLWQQYKQQFHYFYQSQPRWGDQAFWQRRCINLQPLEQERLAL